MCYYIDHPREVKFLEQYKHSPYNDSSHPFDHVEEIQAMIQFFQNGIDAGILKNLPLDFIKIDGIFVSQMLEDKASAIMVDAIHSIGKKLGLMTIAEYVENEETARLLREIGVDLGQGYLFGKPELFIPPPADSH